MMIAIFHPKTRTPSSQTPSSASLGKRKALELDEVENRIGGWVYVGSHNFSPAAWVSPISQQVLSDEWSLTLSLQGTLDTKKSPVTLSIKNYELGIVFPLCESCELIHSRFFILSDKSRRATIQCCR